MKANWENAKANPEKPLDYRTETGLLYKIHKQFKSCKALLVRDFRTNILPFRKALLEWQRKVDKKLAKLGKKQ